MNGAVRKARVEEMHAQAIRRSERGAEAFARAERHSRRVRTLKIALPAMAVLIAAAFAGYSMLPAGPSGVIDLRTASVEDGNLVMENPTLDGFTKDNRPYTMTAARARQALGSSSSPIRLEEIRATVPIDKDDEVNISAAHGTFDRENNRLTLDTAVTLSTTSGLVARLQSAEVDIASNNLSTDEPVQIETQGMRIEANAFRASEGGKTLIFEDNVRVEIDPAQVRRTAGENGENRGND